MRLTLDLWRTSTFSASLFAQLFFTSISAIALSKCHDNHLSAAFDNIIAVVISSVVSIRGQDDGVMWNLLVVVITQLFAALYSIGLCVSLLLAFRDARAQNPDVSWMVNGKDLVAGTIDTAARTTLLGRKRTIDLRPYIFPTRQTFLKLGGAIGAYSVKVFLRRVRYVISQVNLQISNPNQVEVSKVLLKQRGMRLHGTQLPWLP